MNRIGTVTPTLSTRTQWWSNDSDGHAGESTGGPRQPTPLAEHHWRSNRLMATLETSIERNGGITLVRLRLTNPQSTSQTVHLRKEFEGPVWPPRGVDGVVHSWDGASWRATLDPETSRGVGFSTPVELAPDEQPVRLVSTSRRFSDDEPETARLLADLDAWAPPRRVVGEPREQIDQ